MSDFSKLIDDLDPLRRDTEEVTDKQKKIIDKLEDDTEELSDSIKELLSIRDDIRRVEDHRTKREETRYKKKESSDKRKKKSDEVELLEEADNVKKENDLGGALASILGVGSFALLSQVDELTKKLSNLKSLPNLFGSSSTNRITRPSTSGTGTRVGSSVNGTTGGMSRPSDRSTEILRSSNRRLSDTRANLSRMLAEPISRGNSFSRTSPNSTTHQSTIQPFGFGRRVPLKFQIGTTTPNYSVSPTRFQSGGGVGKVVSSFNKVSSEDKKSLELIKSHEALSSFTPGVVDAIIPGSGNKSWISGRKWSDVNANTKLYAYNDSEHIPTIGWGTVDKPGGGRVRLGDSIVKSTADKWLEFKYLEFKNQIVPKIPTWNSMSDNQKAAILSYTYNAGPGWINNDKNAYDAISEGNFHKAAKFWTQGWEGQPELLKRRKEEANLLRSGPVNPLVGIIDKAYAKRPIRKQDGGIVLLSGHGDISSGQTGTRGEKEAAKKVAKRIHDKTGGKIRYIPSQASWSFNGPQDSKNEPSNSNWNLGKQEASRGNIPIELHFNSPGGATGLISSGLSRTLSPAEVGLQNVFGVIGGSYGSPKYGVTMLELQGGAERVNVDQLADKFLSAVNGKFADLSREKTVPAGQPTDNAQSAPPDKENSPQSIIATTGIGFTQMMGMAGNIGKFMQGFIEGFSKTSGIDISSMMNGASTMFSGLFGQPAQAATSPPTGSEPLPTITGTGAEKGRSVMNALMSKGYTREQAAGIVGNIMHESDQFRADTEYGGGGGRGWLQWTGGRRTNFERWCKNNNLDPRSDQANMGYLLHEMSGADGNQWTSGYSESGLRQTKTVEEATDYFMRGYERPGVPALDRRIQYARSLSGKQYGGFIDNSFRNDLSKQVVSRSLELNNHEPIVILDRNSNNKVSIQSPPVNAPTNFGFEYIIGSGDEYKIMNEFYSMIKLAPAV